MKSLASINKYFYKYRWRLILGVIFIIISNYFNIKMPEFVGDGIDAIDEQIGGEGFKWTEEFKNQLLHQTFILGMLVLGPAVMKGIFMYLRRQTGIVVSRLI